MAEFKFVKKKKKINFLQPYKYLGKIDANLKQKKITICLCLFVFEYSLLILLLSNLFLWSKYHLIKEERERQHADIIACISLLKSLNLLIIAINN